MGVLWSDGGGEEMGRINSIRKAILTYSSPRYEKEFENVNDVFELQV